MSKHKHPANRNQPAGRPMLPQTPAERWVVTGLDQYGDPFVFPSHGDAVQTREQAEETIARMKKRGADVSMYREVWSGPSAAFRRPPGENS